MKKALKIMILSLFCLHINAYDALVKAITSYAAKQNSRQSIESEADWFVVGAGPAGICTVGVLLDIGIDKNRIMWLDPEFKVGRMGEFYSHVPANSKAQEFIDFVHVCNAFQEFSCPEIDYLKQLDPDHRGYDLSVIVQPLLKITGHLKTKVTAIQDRLVSLHFMQDAWLIGTQNGKQFSSQHVILATGSHPKVLNYETSKIIPLDYAIDKDHLVNLVTADDIVGVVGSAHSAILILKFLSERPVPVKHIYNLYRTPIEYAPDRSKFSLDRTTGIKGAAAEWAKNVLEKNPPANLTRVLSDSDTLPATLAQCTKVIYAIGFDRNDLPKLNGTEPITTYNEKNGLIAPRLFGIGLAFPELSAETSTAPARYCIGLDCFMNYAQQMIPHWVHDDVFKQSRATALSELTKSSQLFTIYTL